MTAIAEIQEERRQQAYGDDWYLGEFPYAFELRTTASAAPDGPVIFVLPLGPQELKSKRIFRQTISPTLGGIVAEERGLAWQDLSISGVFGLRPKRGRDTTQQTRQGLEPLPATAELSGPAWTQRMLRNVFDRYAELKSDPSTAHATVLIWHNYKDGESYVVVPREVDADRTVARRFQYPFVIQMSAIGLASQLVLPDEELGKLAVVLRDARDVVQTVSQGAALVRAGLDEATAFLAEVQYFVASIDSVFTGITDIVTSAENFVAGVTTSIQIGQATVTTAVESLDTILVELESLTENESGLIPRETVPATVRALYREIQDGLHALLSQPSAFAPGRADQTAAITTRTAGASGLTAEQLSLAAATGAATTAQQYDSQSVKSGDQTRVEAGATPVNREFRKYVGAVNYTVRALDSIQSVSANFYGDSSYWYDIALANDLKPPYISWTGGVNVARPGDVLQIPQLAQTTQTNTPSGSAAATPEELYGRDWLFVEQTGHVVGRPSVGLQVDPATQRDFKTIGGLGSLHQATQLRLWTTKRTMPHYPGYGLLAPVGMGDSRANKVALRVAIQAALLQDSRIDQILSAKITGEGDIIDADIEALIAGPANQSIQTTLV